MTPAQAAEVLRDVGGYEERLSLRAGGLTLMVWGMAAAGIFLSYGTADPYLEQQGLTWAYSILWVPFVAAGVIATKSLWQAHALSLQREHDDRRGVLTMVAGVGGFFAICAVFFFSLDAAGVQWTVSSIMTVVNGLFALAMVAVQRHFAGFTNTPTIWAGLVMVAAGIAIGLAGLPFTAADLLGAFVTGAAWFTAGIVTYARG